MLKIIIFSLIAVIYVIFFFMDRKKALWILFLIKLPLDQVAWNINIPIPFMPLKASEAFGTFIMILILVAFMLDSLKEPDRRGFFRNIPSMLIIPIIMFMMMLFVNALYGGSLFSALPSFFKLTTGIIIGTYVAKTLDTEEEINWLIRCMLLSTVAISILSIPAIYSGGELKIYAPIAGNQNVGTYLDGGVGRYQSATSFAEAFLANVSSILLASIVLRSKWEKFLYLFAIIFTIVAIFASANRSGWLTLIIILITWMVVKRKWKLLVISTFFVLIISTAQIFSGTLQKAYQRIAYESESFGKGEIPDNAFGGRPLIWKTYMTYYMEAPLLDKLIGSNNILYMGGSATGHDPHNDFIFILIKMGIIGLVVTLFLYIVTFFYILKAMLSTDNNYDWDLAFTAILALLTMFITSFARTGFLNPNFEWIFWTFTMLTLKRYTLTKNIEYQSEEYIDIDDESEDSVLEKVD